MKKAPPPISVTLDGIFTLVKELQPSKTEFLILVTLDGISTLVKELQSLYLLLVDYHENSERLRCCYRRERSHYEPQQLGQQVVFTQ